MNIANSQSPFVLQPSMPSRLYTDPAVFAEEQEKIFRNQWLCVAREEDVPEPGDHVILDVQGESIILVRNHEGELRAHYNVCRHRGSRICAVEGERDWNLTIRPGGITRKTITCPYHRWTYDLNGTLVRAPFLSENEAFDPGQFSLFPVGVRSWGGFVFLHLRPELPTASDAEFARQTETAARRLKNYPWADLRTVRTLSYDVAANWKALLENYNECYHCPAVHPELCAIVPEFRNEGGIHLNWEEGIPHREGAWTYTMTGTTNRSPFPGLSETEKTRHKGELVYPMIMISVAAEHVAAFLLMPLAANRTRIDCRFLFHKDEIARPDFDGSDAIDFWDIVNRQDWFVCERVQQGMSSRVHKQGFYAPLEDPGLDIRRYYEALMGPVTG